MPFFPGSYWTEAFRTLTEICQEQRWVTSDDLQSAMDIPPRHHNQVGALFNEAERICLIRWTGRSVQSRRDPAKGRTIKLFESGFFVQQGAPAVDDPVVEYEQQRGNSLQGTFL